MTPGQRQDLRKAAHHAASGPWTLQTSNSFRRIGTPHGDGDVLCAVTQRSDGHPDLLAPPGVLDYIVAAQPHVITALLDDLDALEDKLHVAHGISDKISVVERCLAEMANRLTGFGAAVAQLANLSDPEAVAKARAVFEHQTKMTQATWEQLVSSLRAAEGSLQ